MINDRRADVAMNSVCREPRSIDTNAAVDEEVAVKPLRMSAQVEQVSSR